ncbi:thiol-specific monooxygenase [Plectosphaerella plurivora]|uniref:Thiol-specific monooxygenase n=1 Tax=Plectosphaerella plurivora TaxID=936078 RepID=A0A9P8V395_9PEZI|nr:thiol-specific monooxygenase [Plectosphaerella plurivora]
MCGDTLSDTSASALTEKPFLTGAEVCEVVASMAAKYDHLIQYSTSVENVETLEDGQGVKLTLRREEVDGTDTWYTETFDHLVVATGHNTVPRVPDVPGLNLWRGNLRHATWWRSGEDLKDQRVFIVGNSESAIDIVLQSLPHVRGDIYVSRKSDHPRYPAVFKRPGVKEVTTIARFEEDTIYLDDGTVVKDIDTVIFATGYFYTHPFLSNVRPQEKTGGFRVPGLYQHIFDIHNPDAIAFVGVANVTLTWLAWEKAAFLAALHWSGKLTLPEKHTMLEWEARRLEDKGSKRFHAMDLPYERVAYFDELNELANDVLLQCFPFEWVVELIGTRGWKLEKYGLTEDSLYGRVGGRRGQLGAGIFSRGSGADTGGDESDGPDAEGL